MCNDNKDFKQLKVDVHMFYIDGGQALRIIRLIDPRDPIPMR